MLASNLHKKYDMAIAKLKAAAELEISPVYAKGQLAEIKVRVKNVRAGHNLPTSLTNVREMWLEVTAKDAAGTSCCPAAGSTARERSSRTRGSSIPKAWARTSISPSIPGS